MKRYINYLYILILLFSSITLAQSPSGGPIGGISTGSGSGDMTAATWDSDSNGAIDKNKGGFNVDVSSVSGIPLFTTGTLSWFKVGTLTNTYICTYSITNGLVCNTDPASLGGGISNLVEDTTPQLGGDLDLNSHSITGMVIGTNIQAYNAHLADIAGLTPAEGNILGWSSGHLVNLSTLDLDIVLGTTAVTTDHYLTTNANDELALGVDGSSTNLFSPTVKAATGIFDDDNHTASMAALIDYFLPLGGGTLTGELKLDPTGVEFQPTDALTDCSTFAATGGGIFYDDSEGKFKKCQDNVLTDLDTTGSGSLGSNLSSSSNDILSDTGAILLGGTGNTNNENLTIDFETTANEVAISTSTGVTRLTSTLGFATTGNVLGAINVSVKTAATYTVGTDDAKESYGTLFINGDNDAIAFTLPSAVAGMSACFMQGQGSSGAITVTPGAGDYLVVDGVRGTAATAYNSTGAGGDKLCIISQDDTDWIVTSKQGTWSE